MTLEQRRRLAKNDCLCFSLLILCGILIALNQNAALGLTVSLVSSLLLMLKLYQYFKIPVRVRPNLTYKKNP